MRRAFIFGLSALLSAPCLSAYPFWWWNDSAVVVSPADSSLPAVAIPVGDDPAGGTFGETPIFISYAEQGDVYLTTSFDGGCSFCTPVRVTATPGDSEVPRAVAVGYTSAG